MKIVSINVSKHKGTRKERLDTAALIEGFGLTGDAHAGPWHRQVSFLAAEEIERSRSKGLDVTFGDFAENIATEGIDWKALPIGTRVGLGDSVIVEITQIGKAAVGECFSCDFESILAIGAAAVVFGIDKTAALF